MSSVTFGASILLRPDRAGYLQVNATQSNGMVTGKASVIDTSPEHTEVFNGKPLAAAFETPDKVLVVAQTQMNGLSIRAHVHIEKDGTGAKAGWEIFSNTDNSLLFSSGDDADGNLILHPVPASASRLAITFAPSGSFAKDATK